MELYQLRTFAAVANEGHLTRAAERLHISQPAVSGQIKALEKHFELRLFERSASGMTLTPAGRELLTHAQKVLGAAEELRTAARRLNGSDAIAGRLRLGTVSDPDTTRIGDLLAAAMRRYPQLDLELHNEVSGAALSAVREGELDASFYYGEEPGEDFVAVPLRALVYRAVAPAEWAPRVREASLEQLASLPWVLTPPISTHHGLAQQLFTEHGVEVPRNHVEADNENVIVSLVVSGVGASLMREETALAREAAGEICVWPRGRLRTTLWFVARADRAEDPLVRALLGLVRDVWAPPPARKPRTVQRDAAAEAAT
jgi:DNA-binding transcriptional LysR family regulator